MEIVCRECGSKLIDGHLVSTHGTCFYPNGEEKKLKPKYSKVICKACPECGWMTDFRLENPENVR